MLRDIGFYQKPLPGSADESEIRDDLRQVEGGDVAVVVHGVEGAPAERPEVEAGEGDAIGIDGNGS